jgi:hypothetical protein
MTETQDADWDPRKEQREYVRNAQTGDLGWIVRRSGKPMVKLDRPNQEILRRYIPSEWVPEETQRPLAQIHAARVAFAADCELCRALGLPLHAKRKWAELSEGERAMFTKNGPEKPQARQVLFKSVMDGMSGFVRQ